MAAGRPSKYKNIDLEKVYDLCLLGLTDKELGKFLDVHRDTIQEWIKKHPEFSDTLKRGRKEADADVTKSLYQRATGYECIETKVFLFKGELLTYDVIKHYPPDPVSMIYWLKNRHSSKWRDRPEETGNSEDRKTNTVTLPDGTKIEL